MFKKSVQFKLYQVTSKLNSVSRSSVKGWDEFRSGLQVGPSSDRACRSDRVQVGLAGRARRDVNRVGLKVGPSAGCGPRTSPGWFKTNKIRRKVRGYVNEDVLLTVFPSNSLSWHE